MADLKQIPVQSEQDRKADLIRALTNFVAQIQRDEVPADCFLLIAMDSREYPPIVTPMEYNLLHADVSVMTDYVKLTNAVDMCND